MVANNKNKINLKTNKDLTKWGNDSLIPDSSFSYLLPQPGGAVSSTNLTLLFQLLQSGINSIYFSSSQPSFFNLVPLNKVTLSNIGDDDSLVVLTRDQLLIEMADIITEVVIGTDYITNQSTFDGDSLTEVLDSIDLELDKKINDLEGAVNLNTDYFGVEDENIYPINFSNSNLETDNKWAVPAINELHSEIDTLHSEQIVQDDLISNNSSNIAVLSSTLEGNTNEITSITNPLTAPFNVPSGASNTFTFSSSFDGDLFSVSGTDIVSKKQLESFDFIIKFSVESGTVDKQVQIKDQNDNILETINISKNGGNYAPNFVLKNIQDGQTLNVKFEYLENDEPLVVTSDLVFILTANYYLEVGEIPNTSDNIISTYDDKPTEGINTWKTDINNNTQEIENIKDNYVLREHTSDDGTGTSVILTNLTPGVINLVSRQNDKSSYTSLNINDYQGVFISKREDGEWVTYDPTVWFDSSLITKKYFNENHFKFFDVSNGLDYVTYDDGNSTNATKINFYFSNYSLDLPFSTLIHHSERVIFTLKPDWTDSYDNGGWDFYLDQMHIPVTFSRVDLIELMDGVDEGDAIYKYVGRNTYLRFFHQGGGYYDDNDVLHGDLWYVYWVVITSIEYDDYTDTHTVYYKNITHGGGSYISSIVGYSLRDQDVFYSPGRNNSNQTDTLRGKKVKWVVAKPLSKKEKIILFKNIKPISKKVDYVGKLIDRNKYIIKKDLKNNIKGNKVYSTNRNSKILKENGYKVVSYKTEKYKVKKDKLIRNLKYYIYKKGNK